MRQSRWRQVMARAEAASQQQKRKPRLEYSSHPRPYGWHSRAVLYCTLSRLVAASKTVARIPLSHRSSSCAIRRRETWEWMLTQTEELDPSLW